MSLVIITLALLCLISLKVGIKNPVEDYISPKGTLAVKGLFVIIVFLSHSAGYVTYGSGLIHSLMTKTCSALGQLMVIPFFFYSGYGIAVSAATKKDYGKNLPKKRILPLFMKFAFAVILYLIAAAVTGTRYSAYKIISAFFGWESVGNSNWFVFATFALYIASYIGFGFFKNRKTAVTVTTLLTFVYIGAMMAAGKEILWYDTVLAYPLGMIFALSKDKFDTVTKKFSSWLIMSALCGTAFLGFWYLFKITEGHPVSIMALIFKGLFFATGILLITRRFSPRNKILSFFGKHVFGIYILQRLPMLLLERFFPTFHPVLFSAISFVSTVVLAVLFEKYAVPEKLIHKKEPKKENV